MDPIPFEQPFVEFKAWPEEAWKSEPNDAHARNLGGVEPAVEQPLNYSCRGPRMKWLAIAMCVPVVAMAERQGCCGDSWARSF